MKTIRIISAIAALLFSVTLNAQIDNFSVSEDGKLYWQKVFDTVLEHDGIFNTIVNNGQFLDVLDGDVITFRVVRAKVDYKQLGFTANNIPLYASASDVTCFVTVQIKDGRYRVTADNIILTENRTGGLFKEGTEHNIEVWAVKNGEIAKSFTKASTQLYDKFFSSLFLMEGKSYLDDEW